MVVSSTIKIVVFLVTQKNICFYHFTFTCALFSFQGTILKFGFRNPEFLPLPFSSFKLLNFEIVFDFCSQRCILMRARAVNRKISKIWWAQVDSNHRPHAYQACALTTWAMSPYDLVCRFSIFATFTLSRELVEMNGIEPMTPCLQSRCSPSWATPPNISWSWQPLTLSLINHCRYLFSQSVLKIFSTIYLTTDIISGCLDLQN